MDDLVEESVAVRVGPAGAPVQVLWRGQNWQVMGRPVPWIDRLPWWTWTAERLPQVVEQPMWTVSLVMPGTDKVLEADLSVVQGDWWRLERVRD